MKKIKETKPNGEVTIQAPLVCTSHLSCCEQEGCPGEFRLLPNGALVFNGRCCY